MIRNHHPHFMNGSNASKLLAWLVMAALPLLNSCSPQVRILRVSSPASDYEVKELHVTERPIVAKHDFYPTLRIEGSTSSTETRTSSTARWRMTNS